MTGIDCIITIPGQDVTIIPGRSNSIPIQISFTPSRRISKFVEEVHCESVGVTFPIFMITGGCQAHDVRFDMESISFGLVTKGSQIRKKLSMINYGDIGSRYFAASSNAYSRYWTRFKWNQGAFRPEFDICPVSGYISPGMEVVFDICFTPQKAAPDIRYEVMLDIYDAHETIAFYC